MAKKIGFYALSFLIVLSLSIVVIPVKAGAEGIEGLKIFGDARARYESDTQTRVSGGAYQDRNRSRMRYRLRTGLNYTASENVEFGGRLSSGTGANSPHVIIGSDDNNDNGTAGFSKDSVTIDKAYIKGKYMDGFVWFGKNDIPFYEQNEYFWDADITPEGLGLGYTVKNLGAVSLTLQVGSFTVDECGWETSGGTCGDGSTKSSDYSLLTYQGVVKAGIDSADFTLAYGVAGTDDGINTTDNVTYSLISLQAKVKTIPDIPITLGYDIMSSDDKTTLSGTKGNGSSVDGSGNKAQAGSVINLGASYKDFSFLLMLPSIEKYAVPGTMPQDDWPNYQNDFSGTEARFGYKIAKNMNVDLRYFSGARKTDSGQKEGRTQFNFNVSF